MIVNDINFILKFSQFRKITNVLKSFKIVLFLITFTDAPAYHIPSHNLFPALTHAQSMNSILL